VTLLVCKQVQPEQASQTRGVLGANAHCVLPLALHGPLILFILFHGLQARPEEVDYKRDQGEWNGDSPVDPEVRLEDQRVL
jgi:hypothetical protein